MKPMTQVDDSPAADNEALLMARLAMQEQNRFARRLVGGLLALMLVWLAALLYFKQPQWLKLPAPVQGETIAKTDSAALPQASQVVELNRELARLQQQLGSALTQSLTMKLEALEERIRLGQAGLQDLELLQSIREDIRTLSRQADAGRLPQTTAPGSDGRLLAELGRLESLLYLTLGSFALIVVAGLGYWLRWHSRLRQLDADLTQVRFRLEHRD
ncbi:hypothetical protein MIN45_P1517 [Methylomarinovum tepidoasis]|uniref:Uncharacterized protein n=1 Tax=Methylomarinovum tepidoasis TaxID=2840183 RepID=A0AAU9CB07_9GAMM|nr:hypothetical protein [Methylomarinovum sp. IN45]BCX89147.1 hypothetical protein MIN45_P1517 [Methylomarinovum sp. IN45]